MFNLPIAFEAVSVIGYHILGNEIKQSELQYWNRLEQELFYGSCMDIFSWQQLLAVTTIKAVYSKYILDIKITSLNVHMFQGLKTFLKVNFNLAMA